MSISVNTPIGITTQIGMAIDMNFISIHKIDMKSISMAISILFQILIGISFGVKIDMTFISIWSMIIKI